METPSVYTLAQTKKLVGSTKTTKANPLPTGGEDRLSMSHALASYNHY